MPDIVRGEITDDAPEIRGSIDGVRGESAYAVAVRNGFVGTEEEWLESLKGEKGDPGEVPDLSHFVKDTDIANDNQTYGIVRAPFTNGVGVDINGDLQIVGATSAEIKAGVGTQKPLTPIKQHESTFYGLAKAAGVDEKTSQNQVGTYTDNAKTAIRNMLGVGIANTSTAGLVKDGQSGITIDTDGSLILDYADATKTTSGTTRYAAVVPRFQHYSAFYGLAKAAGVDEKDSTLGTYSSEAKAAIKNMLGVEDGGTSDYTDLTNKPSINNVTLSGNKSLSDIGVHNIPTGGTAGQVLKKSSGTDYDAEWADESGAVNDVQINGSSVVTGGVANVPMASASAFGAVKIPDAGTYDFGIAINSSGQLYTNRASETQVKNGTNLYKPITPNIEHASAFYGLAKAAGDTTQSQSSNAVGNYTDAAKIAIQKMLGIYEAPWELIADVTASEDITEFNITTDTNGEPFELKKMIVIFSANQSTTGTRDSFYTQISARYGISNYTISMPSFMYNSATSAMAVKMEIATNNGAPISVQSVVSSSDGSTATVQSMPKYNIIDAITSFRVYQSGSTKSLIPSGANIKIYGIRL